MKSAAERSTEIYLKYCWRFDQATNDLQETHAILDEFLADIGKEFDVDKDVLATVTVFVSLYVSKRAACWKLLGIEG